MPSTSRVSQVLGKYDFTADDKNASGTSDTTRPGALVAGSKDGTLCLCYRSGEIALYRHPGFELIAKANVDETPVNAAFSDDARLVAVADASGEVIVYLVKDLVKMRQFTGTLSVRTSSPALEFSENNRVLLVGDPMQCSVWNIESGKKLFESRPTMANNTPSSNSWRQKFGHNSLTVFQPGTKAVYADSDRGQEQEFTCSAGSFSCYAVSRPHSLLAVGDTGGHVVVYHLTTGNRVAGPFPVNGVVHDMQFIGDEQVIVTLSGTPAELNLWSTEGQNWLGSLGSFTKANRLTTGGGKNHVILWDGHAELSLGGSFIRVLSLPLFDFEQSEIEVLAGCTEAIASCRVVDGAGSAERYVPQCPFLTTHIKRSQPMKDRVSVWFQWLLSEYEDRMIAPGAEFGPQYWMSLWEERYIKRPHGIPEEGLIEDFLAAEPNDPRVLIKGAELWAAEANRSQSAIGNLALKKAAHIVFLLKHGPATEQVSERISFVEYLLETAQR